MTCRMCRGMGSLFLRQRDALLEDWNAVVAAIGAPKHGTAIAHAAALKARVAALEGVIEARINEAVALHDAIERGNPKGEILVRVHQIKRHLEKALAAGGQNG